VLRNAWEYQQYRKASSYSSIKAALRCSFATRLAHKPLNASLRALVRGLQGRSQALDALCNDWEYQLRKTWEYQQYRKASGYSSIKAALRCSSATCFAHKSLKASLRSFVHGLQGRSQALDALSYDWEYQLRNGLEYQQYRKASGYSSIKAALRCSSATRFAHKPLNASLHSFVHDCKDEVKLLMRCAMIGNIRYAMHGSISYAMHWSTNSIARQVATVASRLRFDALPSHALRTSL